MMSSVGAQGANHKPKYQHTATKHSHLHRWSGHQEGILELANQLGVKQAVENALLT